MERTWKADYEKFARTARENVAATLDSMDYPALERAAGAVGGGVAQAVRILQVVGVHGKPDSLVGRTVGGRVS